jgi:hypothetical protein
MSATLSGLIVLENARPVDGLPLSVTFDGQMWLGPGRILTGEFRYYNSSNDTFPDIGQYFTWIHVRRTLSIFPGVCLHLTGCEIRCTRSHAPHKR